MKKYLAVSLILHLSLLLIAPISKKDQDKVEVTLDQGKSEQIKGRDVQIKDLGDGPGEKPKNYYWGIGITGQTTECSGILGYYIYEVHSGYSADLAGLWVGDCIISVNGQPLTISDISGDKPLKLVLQFYRNGVIMTVYTERTKVWY